MAYLLVDAREEESESEDAMNSKDQKNIKKKRNSIWSSTGSFNGNERSCRKVQRRQSRNQREEQQKDWSDTMFNKPKIVLENQIYWLINSAYKTDYIHLPKINILTNCYSLAT